MSVKTYLTSNYPTVEDMRIAKAGIGIALAFVRKHYRMMDTTDLELVQQSLEDDIDEMENGINE
ncbi:hypothetical protein PMW_99 [Pseudomonas phage phiPMW]|uniref:Uncharacterized protein n=1 Tax=Pseudomonas phage phiPMW TaxID=1815582 RepID=A0A1S5R1D8_9CAUD|nr:hypothetical protein FDG97_gp099 [Pseudomonas phage phiPMW]ANA49224.1 hypothetical protein PMW_99 [Pseudomonas phage phiPMW]